MHQLDHGEVLGILEALADGRRLDELDAKVERTAIHGPPSVRGAVQSAVVPPSAGHTTALRPGKGGSVSRLGDFAPFLNQAAYQFDCTGKKERRAPKCETGMVESQNRWDDGSRTSRIRAFAKGGHDVHRPRPYRALREFGERA